MAVTDPIYKFICEWCEPSDIPALAPNTCRILRCNKCGCETWHWPKEITDPAERQTAVHQYQRQILAEFLRMGKEEFRLVTRFTKAFPVMVSLWGLMAQHINPQPADTRIVIVPPGETAVKETEFVEEDVWSNAPISETVEFKEIQIRLKRLPLACGGTGTILDGLRVDVWHGYSPNSNTTYFWQDRDMWVV